jgi:hypothetical protein
MLRRSKCFRAATRGTRCEVASDARCRSRIGTTVEVALPRESAVEQQGGGAALVAGAVRRISDLPGGIGNPKRKTMLRIG